MRFPHFRKPKAEVVKAKEPKGLGIFCPEPKCGGTLHRLGTTIGGTKLYGCRECSRVYWEI